MQGIYIRPEQHKAIRDNPDQEWQTRQVIKFHKPFESSDSWEVIYQDGGGNWIAWDKDSPGLAEFTKKAYPNGEGFKSRYQVGEVVYIKEALYRNPYFDEAGYLLDRSPVFVNQTIGDMLKWRWERDNLTAMFMPQEAARDFIQITGVRAERLWGITEEDAVAEGCVADFEYVIIHGQEGYRGGYAKEHYTDLWNSINPKQKWDTNPWCFVYTFKQVERPADANVRPV